LGNLPTVANLSKTATNDVRPIYADTGANGSIFREADADLLTYITTKGGQGVKYPDGNIVESIAEGTYRAGPNVPTIRGDIFKSGDLENSLVSMHDYTKQGLAVIFDEDKLIITEKEKVVIQEQDIMLRSDKDREEGLWTMPIPSISHNGRHRDIVQEEVKVHNIVRNQLDAPYVTFIHATYGSPAISTFINAVEKGYLDALPRLTPRMIRQNPPHTVATAKGHLDKRRMNYKSTSKFTSEKLTEANGSRTIRYADTPQDVPWDTTIAAPSPQDAMDPNVMLEENQYSDDTEDEDNGIRAVLPTCYARVIGPGIHAETNSEKNAADYRNDTHYGDATGRFPIRSHAGNEYVFISTYMGYTFMIPMKNRTQESYIDAYSTIVAYLALFGHHPEFARLDNETSNALEAQFVIWNIKFSYAARGTHQTNIAERAIRTAKNHIISTLATVDPSFPKNRWDECLQQATITLNSLTRFRPCPSINAYKGIHGEAYNFIKHPLAPFGTKVMIHESPTDRLTWGDHGTEGFYLGPDLMQHRSFRCLCTASNCERSTETVEWFPTVFQMPGSDPRQVLLGAINDIERALMGLNNNISYPNVSEERIKEAVIPFRSMVEIFQPKVTKRQNPSLKDLEEWLEDYENTEIWPDPEDVAFIEHRDRQQTVPVEPVDIDIARLFEQVPDGPPSKRLKSRRRQMVNRTAYSATRNVRLHKELTSSTKLDTDWRDIIESKPRHFAAATVLCEKTGKPLKHRQLKHTSKADIWEEADHREFIRLVETSQTMYWKKPGELPKGRTASYYNPQPELKPNYAPEDQHRIRGTYGGNRGDPYLEDKSAYVADLTTIKILLNLVVSTPKAQFMSIDIKDFYLGTDLSKFQYMKIRRDQIPQRTIEYFNLSDPSWWYKDQILVEIRKGIYGLPEAGKLAQDRLYAHLATHGFKVAPNTPGLLTHESRDIKFTLVVDDFGIYYTNQADVLFLQKTLEELYIIKTDWTGNKYVGLTIHHDQEAKTLQISMPNYIAKALLRFNIEEMKRTIHSPAKYNARRYQTGPQTSTMDTSEQISEARKKWIQEVIGVILFYARAVDSTMLMPVNRLASRQANPTEQVESEVKHLLQYAASYPVAITTFQASDMKLRIYSDASYNSEEIARSRAGGHHDLIKEGTDPYLEPLNGAILALSSLINCIVASAAEAEYAALFLNAQAGTIIRTTLDDLGCPQGPTPIFTDNQVAEGIANDKITLQKSKSMDMRFHWIRDRVRQHQFTVTWKKGSENVADYFTKVHPPAHYRMMRALFVSQPKKTVSISSKGVLMKAMCARAIRVKYNGKLVPHKGRYIYST